MDYGKYLRQLPGVMINFSLLLSSLMLFVRTESEGNNREIHGREFFVSLAEQNFIACKCIIFNWKLTLEKIHC